MRVSDQVISERKAEIFLMMFGPDDRDSQKVANRLEQKYGTNNPHNIWIKLQMMVKKAQAEMNEHECIQCHKKYDRRDPDSFSDLCGSKCYKSYMEDFVAKHPEFSEERKRFWLSQI